MNTARNVEMNSAISIASYVIHCLYRDEQNIQMMMGYAFSLEDAIKKWAKPHKKTLLHEYIGAVYAEYQEFFLRKHFPIPEIRDMQKLFEYYSIDYSETNPISILEYKDEDCTDEIEEYAERLQSLYIDTVFPIVVDDVFTILYSNKNFLHEFNYQCSEIIKKLVRNDYPDLLKEDGVIKRINYYPNWFRNGIFYRDKGRCSICGCDLSSAFTTIKETNYDHIIPLRLGGNNDPTNWQLTCETCNKRKGARNTEYKNIIFPFWEIDFENDE